MIVGTALRDASDSGAFGVSPSENARALLVRGGPFRRARLVGFTRSAEKRAADAIDEMPQRS